MNPTRIALALAVLAPMGLAAQEDVKAQIQELKKQVEDLEAKTADQEKTLAKVEAKTAQNGIAWGGDLMTRFDSSTWHIDPYQQFNGFVKNTMPGNPYPFMPSTTQMPAQDWSNSVEWSTRLRLRMTMAINENAKIMGRLTMYKIHGGADVPTFNGSPNTVANSFNSGMVPTSDNLVVERASFVYDFRSLGILSIGRQNTSDGPPNEVKEGTERQATPQAMAVNAIVDGMGFKFHLEPLGLPEHSLLGLCYGVGYEAGFGGGGNNHTNYVPVGFNFDGPINGTGAPVMQVNQVGPLKDSTVLGAMLDIPMLFEALGTVHAANLYVGYNRFGNMTDIPFGSLCNFPVPAAPGMGGMPSTQYVTATNNLGDMDQWTVTWKHKIGDTFTYFASAGYIKSHPNGKSSQYGAYYDMPMPGGSTQLMELSGFGGLLGDANHSHTANALFAGVRYDPVPTVGVGLEFNHGSPRWFTYDPAVGEPSQKLGTRGDVLEGYVSWEFVKNVLLRAGYMNYSFSHAYSGWHIAPGPMAGSWEEAYDLTKNPMLQYPYPKTVDDTYVALEVRF